MIARNAKRDTLLLAVLILVHELLRHALADAPIVSSLFSPGGARQKWTLLAGIVFVSVRVMLFVGVPGWLTGELIARISTRLQKKFRSPSRGGACDR